jgi:hypothetical protein
MSHNHQKEAAALKAMLDEERCERMRIVQSLQGTIERVRASGHKEECLKRDIASLSSQLATEQQMHEDCKRILTVATEQLQEARASLSDLQRSSDDAQIARAAEACEQKERLQKVRIDAHSSVLHIVAQVLAGFLQQQGLLQSYLNTPDAYASARKQALPCLSLPQRNLGLRHC